MLPPVHCASCARKNKPAGKYKSGDAIHDENGDQHALRNFVRLVVQKIRDGHQKRGGSQHGEPKSRRHLPEQKHRPKAAGKDGQSKQRGANLDVLQFSR